MSTDPTLSTVADWVQSYLSSDTAVPEVLDHFPELSLLDAYRVQRLLIERRLAAGDRIIGYKAALTSRGMQQKVGIGEPLMGTLLASQAVPEGQPVSLAGYLRAELEPEVAVLLGKDIAGPGVTLPAAAGAVEAVFPAFELADYRLAPERRSAHAGVVVNTSNAGCVPGGTMTRPAGLDLRMEGLVLTVNGERYATATAAEVLDHPLNAVAFIANRLGELGYGLEAGQIVLTGSIVASPPIRSGDHVTMQLTRLGPLSVRFTE